MARPISDEELQLKKRARRRLVGAIVLVSAVAVILPMVLDSEPKSASQNVDIQIPPSDRADLKSTAPTRGANNHHEEGPPAPVNSGTAQPSRASSTPADKDAAQKSVAPAESVSPPAVGATATPPGSIAVTPETPSEPSSPPKDDAQSERPPRKGSHTEGAGEGRPSAAESTQGTPKVAAASKTTSAAYVVQIAALTDRGRAKQLQKQLTGAGVKVYTETVATKAGHVTRVRAGPYSSREAAEKARTQLQKAGLEAKVVPR